MTHVKILLSYCSSLHNMHISTNLQSTITAYLLPELFQRQLFSMLKNYLQSTNTAKRNLPVSSKKLLSMWFSSAMEVDNPGTSEVTSAWRRMRRSDFFLIWNACRLFTRVVASTQSFKYQYKYQYLSLKYQYQYQYPCLKYNYKCQYFGSKYQYQYQYHCTSTCSQYHAAASYRLVQNLKSTTKHNITYSRIYDNALQLTIDQTESDNHHTQINNLFSIFRQTV